MNTLPKARTADILEQEADKELLIYDLRTNKMFRLNETAKTVYQACSKLSFEDLKRTHKYTDDLIYLALDELKANDLLENYRSDHFAGMNRREAVRRVGIATVAALPVISGLVAPTATRAASPRFARCSATQPPGAAVFSSANVATENQCVNYCNSIAVSDGCVYGANGTSCGCYTFRVD